MTTSLARYHARAPRYILDTEDESLIRLSGADKLPWEESTQLLDVSLTGLTFTAPEDLSPQIGEVIKIQFSVPGAEQMACHAVVIRIEKTRQFENLVGVHFYKLDRLQRINIAQGLSLKITAHTSDQAHKRPMTSFLILIGLIAALITWLSIIRLSF